MHGLERSVGRSGRAIARREFIAPCADAVRSCIGPAKSGSPSPLSDSAFRCFAPRTNDLSRCCRKDVESSASEMRLDCTDFDGRTDALEPAWLARSNVGGMSRCMLNWTATDRRHCKIRRSLRFSACLFPFPARSTSIFAAVFMTRPAILSSVGPSSFIFSRRWKRTLSVIYSNGNHVSCWARVYL